MSEVVSSQEPSSYQKKNNVKYSCMPPTHKMRSPQLMTGNCLSLKHFTNILIF